MRVATVVVSAVATAAQTTTTTTAVKMLAHLKAKYDNELGC